MTEVGGPANRIISYVISNEGVYSNHAADTGGPTLYGISLKFLRENHIDITADGEINAEDVVNLTIEEVKKIFFEHWYKRYKYFLLDDDALAAKVMDLAVNIGPANAHKLLQKTANTLFDRQDALHPYLKIDGVLGSKTLARVNYEMGIQHDPQLFMRKLCENAVIFYLDIVKKNTDALIFIEGWVRRALRIPFVDGKDTPHENLDNALKYP